MGLLNPKGSSKEKKKQKKKAIHSHMPADPIK